MDFYDGLSLFGSYHVGVDLPKVLVAKFMGHLSVGKTAECQNYKPNKNRGGSKVLPHLEPGSDMAQLDRSGLPDL